VKLYAPNGNETLLAGGPTKLVWSGSAVGGDVKIEINRDFPSGGWETLFESTPNDGAEDWTVTGPNADHARFRIAHLSVANQTDTSNADCLIRVPVMRFRETNPSRVRLAGSEDQINVEVRDLPGDGWRLELNRNYPDGQWERVTYPGDYKSTVPVSPGGDQFIPWIVRTPETEHARLRMTLDPYPGWPEMIAVMDSDFVIRWPHLRLLYPNGGEVFHVGDEVSLSWESELSPRYLRLWLTTDYPNWNPYD
jgi:hypothetical protein